MSTPHGPRPHHSGPVPPAPPAAPTEKLNASVRSTIPAPPAGLYGGAPAPVPPPPPAPYSSGSYQQAPYQQAPYGHGVYPSGPAPTAARPAGSLSDVLGPVIPVIVAAVVYTLIRLASLGIQIGAGEIAFTSQGQIDAVVIGTAVLSALALIAPIVLVARKVDRPDGRPIVTAMLWAVAAAGVAQLVILIPAVGSLSGVSTTPTVDMVLGALIVAAWVSGRRGSLPALVAGIAGGLAAWAASGIAESMLTGQLSSSTSQGGFQTSMILGTIVHGLLATVFLSAAAWVGVGIDHLTRSYRGALPERPGGMWTAVDPKVRHGVVLLIAAIAVLILRGGLLAMMGASGSTVRMIGIASAAVLLPVAVLVAMAGALAIGDPARKPVIVGLFGLATALAFVGGIGMVLPVMDAEAYAVAVPALWARLALRATFAVVAAGLSVALARAPWAGFIGLLLLFVPPFVPKVDRPLDVLQGAMGNLILVVVVTAAVVWASVPLGKILENVVPVKNQNAPPMQSGPYPVAGPGYPVPGHPGQPFQQNLPPGAPGYPPQTPGPHYGPPPHYRG